MLEGLYELCWPNGEDGEFRSFVASYEFIDPNTVRIAFMKHPQAQEGFGKSLGVVVYENLLGKYDQFPNTSLYEFNKELTDITDKDLRDQGLDINLKFKQGHLANLSKDLKRELSLEDHFLN